MNKQCTRCGISHDPMEDGTFIVCGDCQSEENLHWCNERRQFILECLRTESHQEIIKYLQDRLEHINKEIQKWT